MFTLMIFRTNLFSHELHNLDTGKSYFEQNGTWPHTAFLKEMFGMTGPLNSLFDVNSRFCLATSVTHVFHVNNPKDKVPAVIHHTTGDSVFRNNSIYLYSFQVKLHNLKIKI